MKKLARAFFMFSYRQELIDIARTVRGKIDETKPVYEKSAELNRQLGMLNALEKLDLLV